MSIVLFTGPPGNGKSYGAVKLLADAIVEGKFVATNIKLRQDFPEFVAKRALIRYAKPWSRKRWKNEIARKVHVSESLEELMSLRLEGDRESRGVMVLDEAPDWMNSRDWNSKTRGALVKWFRKHRKLGWDVYLIAQEATMIDAQVRNNFEQHWETRNFKQQVRLLGIPLIPFNLFMVAKLWHSANRVVLGRKFYRLSWPKHLYDHMDLGSDFDVSTSGDRAAIWLPSDPGDRLPGGEGREPAGDRPAAPGEPIAGGGVLLDPEHGRPMPAIVDEPADLDPAVDGASNSRPGLTAETVRRGRNGSR